MITEERWAKISGFLHEVLVKGRRWRFDAVMTGRTEWTKHNPHLDTLVTAFQRFELEPEERMYSIVNRIDGEGIATTLDPDGPIPESALIELAERYDPKNDTFWHTDLDKLSDREDGWIPWEGGKTPVLRNTIVEVRFANGEFHKNTAGAFYWDWLEESDPGRIVAYRVVEESE